MQIKLDCRIVACLLSPFHSGYAGGAQRKYSREWWQSATENAVMRCSRAGLRDGLSQRIEILEKCHKECKEDPCHVDRGSAHLVRLCSIFFFVPSLLLLCFTWFVVACCGPSQVA